MIVRASAAPVCGGEGAAKVAESQAAVETIRAGFDRYIIVGESASNNVRVVQTPGTYNTTIFGGGGLYTGVTTYSPGPSFVVGRHSQDFRIVMFREGEEGAQAAVSARGVLGPNWRDKVNSRILTCF